MRITVSALAAVLLSASVFAQERIIIRVDGSAGRRPINPAIYGVNFATAEQLLDLNVTINRSGGNAESRYNWQSNATNHSQDWYFQSIARESAQAGESGDSFIDASRRGGAQPMITVPTIGWVAKVGPRREKLASFSIAKYGPQTGNDWQWFPDAGNGIRPGGAKITSNDPSDANLRVDSAFQQSWIQHLLQRWGTSGQGGLRYYLIDNEPGLWHETHRDVFPNGLTMEGLLDRIIDYGEMIKRNDAAAVIVAPEEWGWLGYRYSGADVQYAEAHGWSTFPEHVAHGGVDQIPWLLSELKKREDQTARRIVDVLSVHYYPQGGEFSDDVSPPMQLRRNRSTRSLWDPGYVDETWVADKIDLIPRLRSWVETTYPGTKIAVTEYSWGAEQSINGATAQADVLGIFGREGLDLAARWVTPPTGSPVYNAIRMYRNYDGRKSTFGDVSVSTAVPSPDRLSAFSAMRTADGSLTTMIINKLEMAQNGVIELANLSAGPLAEIWQLTSRNEIQRLADRPVSAGILELSLPPQSITLMVVPRSGESRRRAARR